MQEAAKVILADWEWLEGGGHDEKDGRGHGKDTLAEDKGDQAGSNQSVITTGVPYRRTILYDYDTQWQGDQRLPSMPRTSEAMRVKNMAQFLNLHRRRHDPDLLVAMAPDGGPIGTSPRSLYVRSCSVS